MLVVARSLRELSFSSLMKIYEESNRENAATLWPDVPAERALAMAEEEFYHYLCDIFFITPHAFYAIWIENGEYVSALRLDPYRDGMLLEALETSPSCRRKGFGEKLLRSVLSHTHGRIYAHVHKSNIASLKLHKKCGFQKICDHAVYIDGSIDSKSCTLCYEV